MSIRRTVAVVAVTLVLLISPTLANAAPPAGARVVDEARRACVFNGESDNIHRSGTDLSVHAWWRHGGGWCGTDLAVVRVNLQIYRLGFWWDVGSVGTKTVYAGGGSANRAVARVYCGATTELFTFRAKIDVDLVGVPDTPWANYGPEYRHQCYA